MKRNSLLGRSLRTLTQSQLIHSNRRSKFGDKSAGLDSVAGGAGFRRRTAVSRTVAVSFGIALAASNAAAGWLTFNGLDDTPPNGTRDTFTNSSRTLSFSAPPTGYSGTFTITHSDPKPGRLDTSVGIDSYHRNLNLLKGLGGFAAAGLNSLGVNSMAFDSTEIIAGCSPCTQAGSASLDFSLLGAGYLPMGTLMLISDIDGPDFMRDLKAYDNSGRIVAAWLSDLMHFDASGALVPGHQADPIDPGDYSQYSLSNGIYQFPHRNPIGRDTDTPTFLFRTQQDIKAIDFEFGVDRNVPRGFSIFLGSPDVAIPEPTSLLLAAVAMIALARVRRRGVFSG